MLRWFDSITTGITLATITVALWLGLYLVTRAGQSRRAWLAALTVWAVGSWFLYNVLQMSLPNYGKLVWLLWFGQTIKFAPTLWFQLSYQLRLDSGSLNSWQERLGKLVLAVAYALTIYNIWDTSRNFGRVPFPDEISSYILFLSLLIVLPLWTMWNFYRARAETLIPLLRRQLSQLLVATAVAYVGGLYAGLSIYLQWEGPFFPSRAILGIGIILLGYGVVKYDALLEGRSIERDALYSSSGVGLVTLFYAFIAWLLWLTGDATIPAVAIFLLCAVITHTLSDGGRAILDRLVYRGHQRQLRTDLHQLVRVTGRGSPLAEQLQLVLATVCQTSGAAIGFVALRDAGSEIFRVVATREARWRGRQLSAASLSAQHLVNLQTSLQARRHELEGMALLAPLMDEQRQIGALVLGAKLSGDPYHPEDVEYVETVGLQLAAMIVTARQQEMRVHELEQVIEEYLAREGNLQQQMQQLVAIPAIQEPEPVDLDEGQMTSLTEDALRHLSDFAYLGEHQFAQLRVLGAFLPVAEGVEPGATRGGAVTHLDRGKALHALLVQAVAQLRPPGAEPKGNNVPAREWHNYLILHESYIKGELTREIMARLFIGEGTYNRTRRRALRSVAKIVQEMESQAQTGEQTTQAA